MKHVEIITSNHVTIEYELASSGQRALASMIDLSILFAYLVIAGNIINSATFSNGYTSGQITAILMAIPFFVYSFVCESLFGGQTVGKKAMRIKVITMDGQNPGVGPSSIRWAFRLIDLWGTAGALAFILSTSTEKSQRIGDTLANTTVISLSPRAIYTISDILSIKDSSKHTASYPSVIQFNDDDMLLLKNALDRFNKYPNPKHEELLQALALRIGERLQIINNQESNEKFLRTLLQDYIVLTRS